MRQCWHGLLSLKVVDMRLTWSCRRAQIGIQTHHKSDGRMVRWEQWEDGIMGSGVFGYMSYSYNIIWSPAGCGLGEAGIEQVCHEYSCESDFEKACFLQLMFPNVVIFNNVMDLHKGRAADHH